MLLSDNIKNHPKFEIILWQYSDVCQNFQKNAWIQL